MQESTLVERSVHNCGNEYLDESDDQKQEAQLMILTDGTMGSCAGP